MRHNPSTPVTPGRLDERVVRLEESVENIAAGQVALEQTVRSFADRMEREFGRVRDLVAERGRTNWNTVIAGTLLVIALFGAGLTPLWITTSNINDKAQKSVDWETAYERGSIPSSADPRMATFAQTLKEIETQFRAMDMFHNVHFAEQQRMNNIILQIAQGVKPVHYPEGPFFFPEISHDNYDNH